MTTNTLDRPGHLSADRDRLLQSIHKTFAALDFSEENAQVAELEADIRRMHDSIQKAEQRCTEISRALIEDQGPDGKAVADALLSDAPARDAASLGASREGMENERAALRRGIKDLNERIVDARARIQQVESTAFQQLGPIVRPLLDDLAADARAAAQRIVDVFAALDAIGRTTRFNGDIHAVGRAVAGITGEHGLLRAAYRRQVEIPTEIVEMLSPLHGKGAALPVRFSTHATTPMLSPVGVVG